MGFNKTRFLKQSFESRTEEIKVPVLADWFEKDTDPVWLVRNLTGNELNLAEEAQVKNKRIYALAEALVSGENNEKVEALRSIIGTSGDICNEIAKRVEMMVFGSIEPEIDTEIAIKIAENFPIEFMQITNKIIILTGLGSSKAKQKPSGKTPQ